MEGVNRRLRLELELEFDGHRGCSMPDTNMSAATPSATQSPAAPSPANPPQDTQPTLSVAEQAIVEYLRARGHKDAEKAFLQEVEGRSPDEKSKPVEEIGKDEFLRSLAVYAEKASRPGENLLKDSGTVLQELQSMGNPSAIQNLISSIGAVGAEEVISADPTDREEGFRELEAWVDGSLDMYRVSSVIYVKIGAHYPQARI